MNKKIIYIGLFIALTTSNLAYGKIGQPQAGIGDNDTIICEVELLEIIN